MGFKFYLRFLSWLVWRWNSGSHLLPIWRKICDLRINLRMSVHFTKRFCEPGLLEGMAAPKTMLKMMLTKAPIEWEELTWELHLHPLKELATARLHQQGPGLWTSQEMWSRSTHRIRGKDLLICQCWNAPLLLRVGLGHSSLCKERQQEKGIPAEQHLWNTNRKASCPGGRTALT